MKRVLIILLLFLGFRSFEVRSQSTGLPFLKVEMGARQTGMGGAFTGVGDEFQTLFWNPGGLGHIRRWQWSASYNHYFLDIYQADIGYVKQFRALGSRKSALGFHLQTMGMPEWDATQGREPSVNAGHWIAGLAAGQRLDWLHPMFSAGILCRFISTHFDTYSASAWAVNIGVLVKPRRFSLGPWGLGLFDYGRISAGTALLNLGRGPVFDRETTALPKTWRTGAAFQVGTHGGWHVLLAADVVSVIDRPPAGALGLEVGWKDLVTGRIGYRIHDRDLGGLSFGLGFRWDGLLQTMKLPTRFSDVFEINLANAGYGEALAQTYRGTITHFPVAPEPFTLKTPTLAGNKVLGSGVAVHLHWEEAVDPDPYDRVVYFVVLDERSDRVEKAVVQIEKNLDHFLSSGIGDSLRFFTSVDDTACMIPDLEGGIYYWAVAACDLDKNTRPAGRGEKTVARLEVWTPDLQVSQIEFIPNSWITLTPEQGVVRVVVSNNGEVPAGPFAVQIRSRFVESDSSRLIFETAVPGLKAGDEAVLNMEWETPYSGLHEIKVCVDPRNEIFENRRDNNEQAALLMTIPKGTVETPDSIDVMATGYETVEFPIVPEIYFDSLSSEVGEIYYQSRAGFPAVLETLADRLKNDPAVYLELRGSIDRLSGETRRELAAERARQVQRHLIRLGASENQVRIRKEHPDILLGKRSMPSDSMDARWIMQQNRVVSMHTRSDCEAVLFKPVRVAVDTTLDYEGVPFHVNVSSPGGVSESRLQGTTREFSVDLPAGRFGVPLEVSWNGMDRTGKLVPRNQIYGYQLVLEDTLGRLFVTRPDSVFLQETRTLRRWEMFGAAKFARVSPVFEFYWDHLMEIAAELANNPQMRVRFEGHACSIGSESINDALSLKRSESFIQAFRERVKNAFPERAETIFSRIDPPAGYGERIPLTIHLRGRGDVRFGDNHSPVGRYLNRRIMVLLYSEQQSF